MLSEIEERKDERKQRKKGNVNWDLLLVIGGLFKVRYEWRELLDEEILARLNTSVKEQTSIR